jgi:hypothetical protein
MFWSSILDRGPKRGFCRSKQLNCLDRYGGKPRKTSKGKLNIQSLIEEACTPKGQKDGRQEHVATAVVLRALQAETFDSFGAIRPLRLLGIGPRGLQASPRLALWCVVAWARLPLTLILDHVTGDDSSTIHPCQFLGLSYIRYIVSTNLWTQRCKSSNANSSKHEMGIVAPLVICLYPEHRRFLPYAPFVSCSLSASSSLTFNSLSWLFSLSTSESDALDSLLFSPSISTMVIA